MYGNLVNWKSLDVHWERREKAYSGTAEQLLDWRGGGGGGVEGEHISDSILGGGTRYFFLLILYNFRNIGGHVPPSPPCLIRGP